MIKFFFRVHNNELFSRRYPLFENNHYLKEGKWSEFFSNRTNETYAWIRDETEDRWKTHEEFHFVECEYISNLPVQWNLMRFRMWSSREPNALLYETVDPTFPDRDGTRGKKEEEKFRPVRAPGKKTERKRE